MKLPIATQAALERSEREFEKLLASLGLNREQLGKAAEQMKNSNHVNPPRKTVALWTGRRTYHV